MHAWLCREAQADLENHRVRKLLMILDASGKHCLLHIDFRLSAAETFHSLG
jgi:hypothetical protein